MQKAGSLVARTERIWAARAQGRAFLRAHAASMSQTSRNNYTGAPGEPLAHDRGIRMRASESVAENGEMPAAYCCPGAAVVRSCSAVDRYFTAEWMSSKLSALTAYLAFFCASLMACGKGGGGGGGGGAQSSGKAGLCSLHAAEVVEAAPKGWRQHLVRRGTAACMLLRWWRHPRAGGSNCTQAGNSKSCCLKAISPPLPNCQPSPLSPKASTPDLHREALCGHARGSSSSSGSWQYHWLHA